MKELLWMGLGYFSLIIAIVNSDETLLCIGLSCWVLSDLVEVKRKLDERTIP